MFLFRPQVPRDEEVPSLFAFLRRLLFGAPLPTARQIHERLPKFLALPVFSSDAVSSVAYGPEEVLISLAITGGIAWLWSWPIGVAIAILIAIVSISYRQTIFAYPHGGGSYTVAKENLGIYPGLVAAAALLTDYVLTVAVSIAAGIQALVAAFPSMASFTTEWCVLAVALVALANLRGLRESGWLFAGPTYAFVVGLFILVIRGLLQLLFGGHIEPIVRPEYFAHARAAGAPFELSALTILVILRAFSNGCSALTGIEAIANGIPAFRPPESRNAAATMTIMAVILGTLVLGISYLGSAFHALPGTFLTEHQLVGIPRYEVLKDQTLVAQLVDHIFGRGIFYYFVQLATAGILILAANTAYQDFPRLSSILARDRFAPRQLASVGDRLVFSNGIFMLSMLAILLLVIFHGQTTALIPLYAVGVFTAFTLSQTGMGIRQRRLKHPGWQPHMLISSLGAVVTGIVALVIAITKFTQGAYIAIFLIAVLVYIFHKIHRHYIDLGDQLRINEADFTEPPPVRATAIVLTSGIHKGILPALEYAKTLSHDCRALFIEIDPVETALIRDRWEKFGLGVPLVIVESPYRSVLGPVLKYLEEAKKERPDHIVTVVVPEFVPRKWWHKVLHNQSGLFLKVALMFRRDIVVTNVRYYLEK